MEAILLVPIFAITGAFAGAVAACGVIAFDLIAGTHIMNQQVFAGFLLAGAVIAQVGGWGLILWEELRS